MIIDQYKKMKNLFLRQSYIDAWEDYQRSIRKRSFVLNAAILLNGQEPIEVELRKLPEKHIEFASLDLDAHGVVTTAAEIQDCHNPYDSFALHKAALIACGIIPMEGEADLEKILDYKCKSGKELYNILRKNDSYFTGVPFQFVKKSVIVENQLSFYEGILHEDHLYTFQLIHSVKKCAAISNQYYHYRMRYSHHEHTKSNYPIYFFI